MDCYTSKDFKKKTLHISLFESYIAAYLLFTAKDYLV